MKGPQRQPSREPLDNYYDAVYMIKRRSKNTAVTGDPQKAQGRAQDDRGYMANMKDFHGICSTGI